MHEGPGGAQQGPSGAAHRLIEWWALLGGVVLLGVALMTAASAAGGFFGHPLPGDFELTEVLVAVAVFAFLPYCQLVDANVTADIFTARAGRRTVAALSLFAALLAATFSVVLLWRTWAGLIDYRKYVETTAILKVPIWTAYVPAVVSLALLVLACLITLRGAWRAATQR